MTDKEKIKNFDIIGDIHGYADKLENLLQKLGYVLSDGVYSHPDKRNVIFLGDFIDLGLKIRETLHIVKKMCDTGNALAIMGNHEFNAICYHTYDETTKEYIRPHTDKNTDQHKETIAQFKDYPDELTMFIDWFKSLPFYLEFNDFRIVHACWHDEYINWFKHHYKGITLDFLKESTDKKNMPIAFKAVECILKGLEYKLLDGNYFLDKKGHPRAESRIKWWINQNDFKNFGEIIMNCPGNMVMQKIPENELYFYQEEKPVFFGHYKLYYNPKIENPSAVCLDYGVLDGGDLVAYRINNNKVMVNDDQLVY